MAQLSTTEPNEGPIAIECAPAPLEPDLFRDAMSLLAGGVAIVTCWDGETPRGLLVSSITGLSLDPARVLFCVRKASSSHNALLRATRCGVAILAEGDEREAERFSQSDLSHERFDPERWILQPDSPPRRRQALIGLEGAIGHRIDAGTHTIFILNVREVRHGRDKPLIYFDRNFRRLRLPEDMLVTPESLCGVTVWTNPAAEPQCGQAATTC
jgi:flavin reductase